MSSRKFFGGKSQNIEKIEQEIAHAPLIYFVYVHMRP